MQPGHEGAASGFAAEATAVAGVVMMGLLRFLAMFYASAILLACVLVGGIVLTGLDGWAAVATTLLGMVFGGVLLGVFAERLLR